MDLRLYTTSEQSFSLSISIVFFITYVVGLIVIYQQNQNSDTTTFYRFYIYVILALTVANVGLMIFTSLGIKPNQNFEHDLNNSVFNYGEKISSLNLDKLQVHLSCCGFHGFDDFNKTTHQLKIPTSCCQINEVVCTKELSFEKGCFDTYLEKQNLFKFVTLLSIGVSIPISLLTVGLFFYFTNKSTQN